MVTVTTGSLFEVVHGFYVVPVEVVLHDVVDDLWLRLGEQCLNWAVVKNGALYEPLNQGLEGFDWYFGQLQVVPVVLQQP